MGYKYNEDEILAAAVEAVLADGLSNLSFGRLAKRIGVADRSIVYYFPTKADLVTRTAFAIGGRLQEILERAFGDGPLTSDQLLRKAWPILASPESDPVFAVFLELIGLGAASVPPYDELAPMVLNAWVDWLVPLIDAPNPDTARAVAFASVATLDGLLLVRHTSGPDAAKAAAVQLGLIDR